MNLSEIEKLQELHYPIMVVDENHPPQIPYAPPCRTFKTHLFGDTETKESIMLTEAWRLYIIKSRIEGGY